MLAHNANFPDADHDVHDVEEIPPWRFRRTALLWASPECVNHTHCKGRRDDSPEAQRSRATFKDIVRFTAYHHYDVVLVDNVVEARLRCEHQNCACGADFDAWVQAMLDEGYEYRIVYFNSQFALPTAQSRDRMYMIYLNNFGHYVSHLGDFSQVDRCHHSRIPGVSQGLAEKGHARQDTGTRAA